MISERSYIISEVFIIISDMSEMILDVQWAIPFNKNTPLLRKLIMSIWSKYGQINEVRRVFCLKLIMSRGIFQKLIVSDGCSHRN